MCVFASQARQIHVSTDDSEVKATLRQFGEPICKQYVCALSECPFYCYSDAGVVCSRHAIHKFEICKGEHKFEVSKGKHDFKICKGKHKREICRGKRI